MWLSSIQSRWNVRVGFHQNADFCVWVLEKNGLLAAPFDSLEQKEFSRGETHISNISPGDWHIWINNVLASPQAIPPSLWHGGSLIGTILAQQWKVYQTFVSQRCQWEPLLVPQVMQNIPELYALLEPYNSHLGSLDIILVNYRYTTHYVIYPSFILISIANEYIDSETFKDHVLSGVEELTKASLKGNKLTEDSPVLPLPWENILDKVPIEFKGQFQPYLDQLKRSPLSVQKRFFQLFFIFDKIKEKGTVKGYIKNIMTVGKDKIVVIALDDIELSAPEKDISRSSSQEFSPGNEVSISVQKFDKDGIHILYTLL